MAVKLNAHQVKNFAFEPTRAEPNGDKRVNASVIARNVTAEADLFLFGNRGQVILQFKTGLDGVSVDARNVREEVELQRVTTLLRSCAHKAMRDNNGRLAVEFDDFFDYSWIPRAQMLDDSLSVLVCVIRHSFLFTRCRLFVPVERALFPEIEISDQQDGNVDHHLEKAIPAETAKNISPRVKKNRFHVEQNEDHCDEIKLHGKGFASVAGRFHTAFVCLKLSLAWAAPANELRKACDNPSQESGD